MRKIINGKAYDTDTAERIVNWDNGYYTNDFHYCSETLYRKRTGEFFIHGGGGALSSWSESVGQNTWQGGTGIRPLTLAEAKEWVEARANDQYEEVFGPVEEE